MNLLDRLRRRRGPEPVAAPPPAFFARYGEARGLEEPGGLPPVNPPPDMIVNWPPARPRRPRRS